MTEHADPVLPVLWRAGTAAVESAPLTGLRAGAPADLAAGLCALVLRYGGLRPVTLWGRAEGGDAWTQWQVDPAELAGTGPSVPTLGACRAAFARRGAAFDQGLELSVEPQSSPAVFALSPAADGSWTLRLRATARPDDEQAPARITAHLAAYLAAPDELRIDQVEHLTAAEHELVAEVNRPQPPLTEPHCLHQRVERQVAAGPERTAVVQGPLSLTYGELDARANALAVRIADHGVGPGGRVGVAATRSVELVVAAYAALKTGAAFVPLDPMLPAHRREVLHRLGRVDVVVADAGGAAHPATGVPVIALGPVEELPTASREALPEVDVTGRDLAYVIFTSGSSGEPKGALLDHVGRTSMILDLSSRYGLGPGDRILGVSSPSFDMTVYDMFAALMTGATLVLPERGRENDVEHWAELVEHAGITVWHSVPSSLAQFLRTWGEEERTGALRAFLLGGDWIPLAQPELTRKAFPEARFISLGGATEVSVDSTYYDVAAVDPGWRSIPYGRAMTNQSAYVLDAFGTPAAVDQLGELFLGGLGVGWGYQDRPAFTAERFLPDPFSAVPGARLYRTGDLARLRADGELELIGRVDHQVKIGGVRIELGEIQSCLREHPAVADAIVVPVRDSAGIAQSLAAYVSVAEAAEASTEDLRAHLRRRLPESMVPARVFALAELPVNQNGKIARPELERLAAEAAAAPAAPERPTDPAVRTAVGETWHEVLGLAEVPGAAASFIDLGGNSLAAIQVVGRLNRRFGTALKVADLIAADTVAAVAAIVTERRGTSTRPSLR
ncbi:amino acid adenylation domain-containing protein [Kitasatospora sp. NPDC098652]|uniref:amino acid adenylation domain-containing protein n=1 Tax=Kitasatospora sp. NPDC098652 TaxID=3364095 RepID=UPI0037FC7426